LAYLSSSAVKNPQSFSVKLIKDISLIQKKARNCFVLSTLFNIVKK